MRFFLPELFQEHQNPGMRDYRRTGKGKRGIYGGAVGYLDFAGNVDTCISIRLAYKKNGSVRVQSGAGIVADSIPENEFQECLNKAGAVLQAIKIAEGGLDDTFD